MKMNDSYSNATYWLAGILAFFAGLTLQDWGFIIGLAVSIALGILTNTFRTRLATPR
ncbi:MULTISPECIES: hypothetical protein [Serratia]|uniref:hypothetical protein n=1 Tax=Serratia TaxID=613 RepID=UPI000AF1FC6D|nr:hypothetical protein [Serratia marcescens]MBH2710185.1 hypothetical protein [Serratia marcescens]BEL89334.1 hypothetical protein SM14BL03_12420 [Serratia marcescens]CAI1715949.1 Uncharacterised protein [Serratia marcescens]HEJ7053633.1 hypothetical protein [Serratia marcescens]